MTNKESIKKYRQTPNGKIKTYEAMIRYLRRKIKEVKNTQKTI
jgi:hypothetical protein